MQTKTALLSVYDKTNLVDFARGLSDLDISLISSGGTAKKIAEAGVPVTEAAQLTGFPELLDGRVKTLHPVIHGGILADRDKAAHLTALTENKIGLIDFVVVNLYPFEQTIAKTKVSLEEVIENIDIGGPTLIRSAAKNHQHVGVVCDPADYEDVLTQLKSGKGLDESTRRRLAVKAFEHTARYDAAINEYLSKRFGLASLFPQTRALTLLKQFDLRYGENPHQKAAFYREPCVFEPSVTSASQVAGEKQLSFNNILDLDAAFEMVKEFDEPTVSVIKHMNPAGVASAATISEAYRLAHSVDPMSAFGCVVGFNREVGADTAQQIVSTFVEAVIATSYTAEAVEICRQKKNMRVLETGDLSEERGGLDFKKVVGGMLIQERDLRYVDGADLKTVSKRKPTEDEIKSMLYAWRVARNTKSNSIVFAKKDHIVGVGAGQMSRVDAVKIAVMKAKEHARGAAMASDAFFPFRDGVDEAAKAGVTAAIHPGGSIRDGEVIDAADDHDMAMVFCGIRCFKH
ncbi:MAG: bifunctional phosphoribosylaminoimidazolecarboxamide formyltransferase/IMP cyclohydrolase [Candidatus Altiarchaeales archaeon]|nr:bifunctional phosphoribosylaminoimidazolecarboxamide formyltransferase/IMP cyclohydrolase [Candidatus Altiarchaeales archaeon]